LFTAIESLTKSPDARVARRAALLLVFADARPYPNPHSAARARAIEAASVALRDPSVTGFVDDVVLVGTDAAPLVPALRERLSAAPRERRATLEALAGVGEAALPALPDLLGLLRDPKARGDVAYVEAAIAAIGPAARERATPAIVAALARDAWALPSALRALDRLGSRLSDEEWRTIARVWKERCSVRSFGPHELDKPDCDAGDAPMKSVAERNHRRVPREREE
jgi:hypothetical protein